MGQDSLKASRLPTLPAIPRRFTPTSPQIAIVKPNVEEFDVPLDDLLDAAFIHDIAVSRTQTRPLTLREAELRELRLAEERRIAANAKQCIRSCK